MYVFKIHLKFGFSLINLSAQLTKIIFYIRYHATSEQQKL